MARRRINREGKALLVALAFAVSTGLGVGIGLSGGHTEAKEPSVGFVVMKTVPMKADMQKYTYDVAQEYGLDWSLLMAVMQKESRFDETAMSGSGDFGLMQINKINHPRLSVELGIHDFLNPKDNIRAGAYMLSQLLSKYQDVDMALMAYNMGETGASEWWEQGIYTSAYSREVRSIQQALLAANREGAMA